MKILILRTGTTFFTTDLLMKKNLWPAFFVLCLTAAQAKVFEFDFLTGALRGTNEVPPNASPATGGETGTGITYDTATGLLTINAAYGLFGFPPLAGSYVVAHLHQSPAGSNGPVIVDLANLHNPSGTSGGFFAGAVNLTPVQASNLFANLVYLNVHSTTFPGGEIRDQLVPLPSAPDILVQPMSQTVSTEQDATFEVTAVGPGDLGYQWRFGGMNISNANSNSFTRGSVQVGDAGDYSVVVTNNHGSVTSLVATLTVGHTLTISVAPANSGTVTNSPNLPYYAPDSDVTLSAVPSTSWVFSEWSGDASGTNNPLSVVMTNNKSITARFLPTYFLTLSTNGSGTVSRQPDQSIYVSNSIVNLTATPALGQYFVGWSGAAGGANNPLTVAMATNKSIGANFGPLTLAIQSSAGGSVLANPNQPPYALNSTVRLTALPVAGWTFTGWFGDASGTGNPFDLTMSNPKTVTASFASAIPDLIVDNTNATFSGPWTLDSGGAGSGFFAQNFMYATTVSSATGIATFRPNLPATGNYDIHVWYPLALMGGRRCQDAQYSINHTGGNEAVSVDQRSGTGSWQLIATGKRFAAGTNGYVQLSNQSTDTGRSAQADAVRWAWSSNQVTIPYITEVVRNSTNLTLTWLSGSNEVYRLQYKTNLTDANWINVTGDVPATSITASKTDSTLGNAAQRFYRVQLLQ
jgi:uncharacterized repeat protein (TIGR02543 family)